MFGRWTAPSLNAVDKWMPRLWWAAAAVGIAVLAYRNFPWFRSLADNPVFMLVFPLVLTGLRWWFRKRGVAGPLPGDTTPARGEPMTLTRDRGRFRGGRTSQLRSGPPVQDDGASSTTTSNAAVSTAAPGFTCTTMRYAPGSGKTKGNVTRLAGPGGEWPPVCQDDGASSTTTSNAAVSTAAPGFTCTTMR